MENTQRPGGISARETWHAEVEDIQALCKFMAEANPTLNYVIPNMPVLNQMARQFKDELRIPGVKAVKEIGITART
jgi:hypothetical protein